MLNYLNISQIVYYFIFYSFFGYFLENLYLIYESKKFVNSGFLIGPFCPIYAVSALSLFIFFEPISQHPLFFFLGAIILTSVIEYTTSLILESVFKTKWWDYSNEKFNLHGRICLKTSLSWGVLSTFIYYFVHPSVEIITNKIGNTLPSYIPYLIILYFLIDFSLTINSLVNLKIIYLKLKKLGDKYEENLIKFKKEHLSKIDFDEIKENFQQKQSQIYNKLKKKYKRLPKAFPNINIIINQFKKD